MDKRIHTFFGDTPENNCFVWYDTQRNALRSSFHFREFKFWKRVYIALRYIFKPKVQPNRTGNCYYTFYMKPYDKERMMNLIRKLQ